MPSSHSAFCDYFRKGYPGKAPKHQQSFCLSHCRPDTRTLAQETYTYLPIPCWPKEKHALQCFKYFHLELLNTNKTFKPREQSGEFFPYKGSLSRCYLSDLSGRVEHSYSESLCLVFQSNRVLSPPGMENQPSSLLLSNNTDNANTSGKKSVSDQG